MHAICHAFCEKKVVIDKSINRQQWSVEASLFSFHVSKLGSQELALN